MRRAPRSLVAAAAAFILPSAAHARRGDLDPAWNGDGIVITNLGSSSDLAAGIARQSDGKIVVAGGSGVQHVVRYADDGARPQLRDRRHRRDAFPVVVLQQHLAAGRRARRERAANGGCWETTFSTTGVRVSDGFRFVCRSD